MHSNKISENRELKSNKVENHDISLSHTFSWERKEKSLSISLNREKIFYLFCRDYSCW